MGQVLSMYGSTSAGMDIGVKVNSMQAFALARKRYSSDSQLYSVRWGSEPVPNDAVQSGRPPRIYEDTPVHMPNTEVKLANKYIAILTHLLRHWSKIQIQA